MKSLLVLALVAACCRGFLLGTPLVRRHARCFASSEKSDDVDAMLARAKELRLEAEALEATIERPPPPPPPAPKGPPEAPENVQRQVVNAFDNLPPWESKEALVSVTHAPSDILLGAPLGRGQ